MQNRKSQLKQIVDALGDMAQCGQNHLHGRLNREYPPYRWGRGGAIILHITQEASWCEATGVHHLSCWRGCGGAVVVASRDIGPGAADRCARKRAVASP
jgi:hypothetical protein